MLPIIAEIIIGATKPMMKLHIMITGHISNVTKFNIAAIANNMTTIGFEPM